MSVTVVAATNLEATAVRKAVPPDVRVVESGIALARGASFGDAAVSCGLAGGLRDDLPTGTVLIPRCVLRPDGTSVQCDPELTAALVAAARSRGHEPVDAPLVTSSQLVHGAQRTQWASRGYAGVDMETGLIDAPRLACVRVILDTPKREISPAWEKPASVLLHPKAWLDLPFLAREGPRCARLAAEIVAAALRS